MVRSRSWFGFMLLAFSLCACTHPLHRPTAPESTPEEARQRLEREGQRRQRMSAYLRARMTGLSGMLSSAEIDVAVETPAKVFLSIRSFFGQPMYAVATDGVVATALDATAEQPIFMSGPATAYAFEKLLGAALWPYEAVSVFLAIAPAAGARPLDIQYAHSQGHYTLTLLEPSGRRSEIKARTADDALISWIAYQPDGKPAFRISYAKLSSINGVTFPARWELSAEGPTGPRTLVFEAIELDLNGPNLAPELFRLRAPPGISTRPLSFTDDSAN